MIKQWSDGKNFIVEDIIVYTAVIICDLGYDFFRNLLFHAGLQRTTHPIDIGMFQVFVAFSFVMLLIRKIAQLRYYW